MKDVFTLFARYNAHANRELYRILATLPPETLGQKHGSFFGSVTGTLNHLLRSDLAWLNRFRSFPVTAVPALDSHAIELPSSAGPILHESFPELRVRRAAVDGVFERFIGELSEEACVSTIEYTDARGKQHRYQVFQVLMHLCNHQTHHRGQISQILDSLGVEHDFSGITQMIAAGK